MYPSHSRLNAFSLIEVLIVIAILVVLISLAMPGLSNARESAKRVVCLNQLKQIHLASVNYIQANANRRSVLGDFPPLSLGVSFGGSSTYDVTVVRRTAAESGWGLFPDNRIWRCPTDEKPGTTPVTTEAGQSQDWSCSYGYNLLLVLNRPSYAKIPNPSNVAFLYDGSMSGADGSTAGGRNIAGTYLTVDDYITGSMVKRHKVEKANVIYLDGHGDSQSTLAAASFDPGANNGISAAASSGTGSSGTGTGTGAGGNGNNGNGNGNNGNGNGNNGNNGNGNGNGNGNNGNGNGNNGNNGNGNGNNGNGNGNNGVGNGSGGGKDGNRGNN